MKLFFSGAFVALPACQDSQETCLEAGIIPGNYYEQTRHDLEICFIRDGKDFCSYSPREEVILGKDCPKNDVDVKTHGNSSKDEEGKNQGDQHEDTDDKCDPKEVLVYSISFEDGEVSEWGVNGIPEDYVLIHAETDCFILENGDQFNLAIFVDGSLSEKNKTIPLSSFTTFKLTHEEEIPSGQCDLTDSLIHFEKPGVSGYMDLVGDIDTNEIPSSLPKI